MLSELAIQDLALIERARLEFGGGLNVITGETGAGKSLLVDALELLLGRRARAGFVRKGADRARVEGRFVLPADGYSDLVRAWLEEHLPQALEEEAEADELELILTRTIAADGRSRAHVNHRPVTQRSMRELSAMLVEIHGQHDHQRLFEPLEQVRLIDAYGGLEGALAGYREHRRRWIELSERIDELETGEAERLQRLDWLRFQVHELDEADPSVEGHASLVAERETLRYAERLREELGALSYRLADSDGAALDTVREAERVVGDWSQRVEELSAPARELAGAASQLEEAAVALARFLDRVEADPQRLDEVEALLDVLERLQRKHRTDLPGLVERRAELAVELAELEGSVEGREDLVERRDLAREATLESGRRLGAARRALTKKLTGEVHAGLEQLGLQQARFSIEFSGESSQGGAGETAPLDLEAERRLFGPHGIERAEFLLAANRGEDPKPLRAVASGGEAARIMLALRGALSVKRSTPTLVFDEVDAGVGGRLGPRVGAHLRGVAAHHQVLCVTHLPAIAAGADQHMRVEKSVRRGRTRTEVQLLAGDARVEEVAAMIAGSGDAATARAEARRLLEAP